MKRILILCLSLCSISTASSKIALVIKVNGKVSVIEQANVAIMYLDDKSVIKMLGNSDLTVSGKRSGTLINKSLDIKYGKIAASITPQKGNEFRIATPTSVASVKGTELTIDSQPGIGDSFTLLEGLIEVTNTITGESTEVEIGETVVSTPEGSLEVHETTMDDIAGFELADIEIPTQEIRFEVEDEDGNIKEIIIRFE